jgi:hypothetical protein
VVGGAGEEERGGDEVGHGEQGPAGAEDEKGDLRRRAVEEEGVPVAGGWREREG